MDKGERVKRLTRLCQEAIEDFKPANGETYCNFGLIYICKEIGYTGFANLTANEIIGKMKTSMYMSMQRVTN